MRKFLCPAHTLDRRLQFRARLAQAGDSNTRGVVILSFFTLTAPDRYTFGQTHRDWIRVVENRQRLGFYGLSGRLLNSPGFFFPLGEAGSLV